MKNVCILSIIFLFIFSPTAFLADRWTWVDSNNMYSSFVDISTIKTQTVNTIPEYANYNSIESVDLWAKITYDSDGGQQELDFLNVQYPDPSAISSTIHLRLNFLKNTVDILDGVLYDSKGSVLANYVPGYGYDIVLSPKYTEIYYYTLDLFTKNNELKKSRDFIYILDSYFDDNGKKHIVFTDKMTIRSVASHIYCYLYTVGTAPNNSVNDTFIEKVDFNLDNNTYSSSARSFYNGDHWISRNSPWNKLRTIYPESILEYIKKRLISYCQDNYAWVHRYDNGIRDISKVVSDKNFVYKSPYFNFNR